MEENGEHHKAFLWSIEEATDRHTVQIGVSACGATAVVDVLQALGIVVAPETADRSVQTKLRRNHSPLPDYLHSRSEAGTCIYTCPIHRYHFSTNMEHVLYWFLQPILNCSEQTDQK